jgi:predicted RND superfamily exporter protein
LAAVHRHLDEVVPAGWAVTVTGPLEVVQVMIDAIRTTQLRSFGAAAVIVFGLVTAFFGSLRLGLLAMGPTGLPVLATLGLMGLLGRPLDVGSAMVAAVVLGIAVDDAIYLLTACERARAHGHAPREAMRMAVARTGPAIVSTSLALAAGFLTLLLSPWHSIASFGLLATAAVLLALLAVLVVLPATAGPSPGHGRARHRR